MKHIHTGAKTAAGMHSLFRRTQLFDTGSCSFTHPTVIDNHYSFVPQIHTVML